MPLDYKQIRRQALAQELPLNTEIVQTVQGAAPDYQFLINPAGQNVFLYLTNYVKTISEKHFDKNIRELRILDWGCGKGHVSYLLKNLGANPTSCDIDRNMDDSSFGQAVPIIDRYQIEVDPLSHPYQLPYSDHSFEIVLSFGVLEHVSNDLESLKELNRVLKPGGLFFCFNFPYYFSWTQRLWHLRGNYYHDRLYTKSWVTKHLPHSNFSLLDFWHRQLFPKNTVHYPNYHKFEKLDQFLTENTPLKYLATNIEFLATKP